MSEDTSCGRGDDVTAFQKGQIIDLHQANKSERRLLKLSGALLCKTWMWRIIIRVEKIWPENNLEWLWRFKS